MVVQRATHGRKPILSAKLVVVRALHAVVALGRNGRSAHYVDYIGLTQDGLSTLAQVSSSSESEQPFNLRKVILRKSYYSKNCDERYSFGKQKLYHQGACFPICPV